jgi:uncharacterized protein (DUF58 family)
VNETTRADPGLADVLAEVKRIDLQTRRLVTGVMAGGYLSVFRGAGIEFDSVREYADGDDPRAIDWSVTARMGRPFVKSYVDERELSVLFLLDLSASTSGGYGPWSVRQTAARVCACLAFSAVRNGDKAGMIAFSDRVESYVAPRKGVPHALRLVRDCLALPTTGTGTDMAPALEFAARGVRRHAVVFLVSDFLTDGWQQPLAVCARRHDVIAIRLLGPELELPMRGLVRLRDPETGAARVVDAGSPRVRRAWDERLVAWRRRTEQALRRAHVDRMDVRVPRARDPEAVVRPILRFFRMREMRGVKR